MRLTRFPWITVAAAAVLTCAGAARAADVQWSIGIQAPVGPGVSVGTVISNRHVGAVVVALLPIYAPAPVVYAPPPVVYAPAPVVYAPAPVVYSPPAQVYAPPPRWEPRRVVWGAPVWVAGRWVYPSHRHHRAEPIWSDRHEHDSRGDHRRLPQYVPSRNVDRAVRY